MSLPNPNDPNDNRNYKERKLPRPVEQVRAELSADPDVKEQARLLNIPVADYVEKIIDYATHPDKPPQVWVLPDEQLKAENPNIPTLDEVKTYMEKVVSGEVVLNPAYRPDGFGVDDPNRQRYESALGAGGAAKGAPEIKNTDPKKG